MLPDETYLLYDKFRVFNTLIYDKFMFLANKVTKNSPPGAVKKKKVHLVKIKKIRLLHFNRLQATPLCLGQT